MFLSVIVDCVYYRLSVCDFCVMAYTRVQNSGHFLAMLAWLRHLGLTEVCADCNNKISYKKYNYKCAVLKIS